ncbi:hypothetical protein [Streptomyces sp. NPDC021139]|uniref:hypothetical protein n=1 Tax=unclassified Streptomyces TaxID=2593676 RepID=UPI0033E8EF90
MFIDRALRKLTMASVTLFIVASALLDAAHQSTVLALLAIALWGIAFGGSATQAQTAMGEAAGDNADAANAMLTTLLNMALVAVGFGRRAAFSAGPLIENGPGHSSWPAMRAMASTPIVITMPSHPRLLHSCG